MTLLIQGGRVLDPAQNLEIEADVLIADGRIQAVGPALSAPQARVLKATGCVVCPGLVDLHVHLREPGFEPKETLATGTQAAARGGFTTVSCMPNTQPVIDCGAALADLRARIRRAAVVNVLPQASLTRGHGQEELSDFAELTEAVALTDDAFPLQRADVMRAALREAARRGKLVTVHCEDTTLTAGGVMNEGEVSRALGVKGMPACAEEVMLARNLILAAEAGCRLHVLHLSTAGAVALIRWAKEQGWPVTAEACPHHFCLTEEAVREQGPNAKMNPPLRTAQDVQAIRSALAEGTIDAIATDHAPHTVPEKERGLEAAPFGIVGLETALPLVLTELVEPGLLSLTAALAKLTYLPANILGCDRGTLRPGAVADVTVFDPQAEVVVNPEEFASRGRNTPFAGRRLCGRVRATIVSGKVVYEA